MLRSFLRSILPNPFDKLLRKAARKGQTRFLLAWNRGLGDIPLGLFAILFRIHELVPGARVSFIVRKGLVDGFSMLQPYEILPADFIRGEPIDIDKSLKSLGRSRAEWDLVIEKPDPTYWVRWQLGVLTPKLFWDASWDNLFLDFPLYPSEKYIGIHLQTETSYGYEKNWPLPYFETLIQKINREKGRKVILFGVSKASIMPVEGAIDLRGMTTLPQMLSVIKNCCSHLVAPDSGVLSIMYYIDAHFPLHIVSLWADPRQGVLKQNVSSPNKELIHAPLIAHGGDLQNITVEQVMGSLNLVENEVRS